MAGFDDIKDKGLLSHKGSELLKSRQERLQNKSVQEVRVLEKIAQDMAEIDKLKNTIHDNFDQKLKEITLLSSRVEELRKVAAQVERGRIHGAEKQFRQSTTTITSQAHTLSEIAHASRSSSILGPAVSMAYGRSTGELEDYVARNRSMLAKQSERIRETASDINGRESQYTVQMRVRENLISNISQAQAALQAQRKLGIDTSSQYYNAIDVVSRVGREQELRGISAGVSVGSFGSRKQVEAELESVSKKLISTFEKLDEAVKKGSKEADALGKQFSSLEKEYRKNKDIIDTMNRQGDGRSGIQVAGGIIGNLGTVMQGIGQGTRYMGVSSELMQMQNRVGFANMANQRFQDVYSASQGDMSALRRVMSNQYAEQVRRGFTMAGREDAALLMETAGIAGKAIGTGIDKVTGPEGIWAGIKGFIAGGPAGAAVSAGAKGLAEATPEALAFAKSMTDYTKQISQGQTFLQSAQQMRAMQDALSQISDFTSQAAVDQFRGTTIATRGLGVGAVGANYYTPRTITGGGMGAGIMHPTGGVGRISSGFGHRHDPVTGREGAFHSGIDIAAPAGTPLYAVGTGKVIARGYDKRSGNFVRISSDGKVYGYAHMQEPSPLNVGDEVARGDTVGAVGSTGRSTGAHLHFTAREGTRRIDPATLLGGGMSVTSQGMLGGGDRQSLQSLLSDPAIISMIANQGGLSGKDINRLVGIGVSGLGKEFTRGGGMGGINDLVRAGELSRIGYMQSPEQYFQARSMMTTTGGTSDNLEEILKNAVANGMDSSKNIMEMVQATTSLSQRSAALGIASFGGAAEGLGRGIDILRGSGVSTNMAVAAAQRSAEAAENMAASKDLDISNVIETARIRKAFPRASLQQMESMRTASPQQLEELKRLYRGGKTEEGRQMSIRMGLYGQLNTVEDVERLQESTSEQILRRTTGFGVDRRMEESIQEKRRKGQSLSPDEQSFLNGMGIQTTGASGVGIFGYSNFRGSANRGALATAPGGIVAGGEDVMRAGATSDARVFADGVANFNKAVGGLEGLGQTLMRVADAVKPEEYSKSVKEAANDLKIPMNALGTNVKELNTSVGELIKAIKSVSGKGADFLLKQVNYGQTRK